MKICGFTFIRNAVTYDYPVVESISSILPIVDEFIVSIGNCDDGTLELIESIGSPKIRIVHSVWDDTIKKGGKVLAVETDKALAHVPPGYDWAFYLQADEVIHESYLEGIVAAAEQYAGDPAVEGLLFNYLHFYGSYDYVGDSRRWYNHEIRLIKNNGQIVSYKDAQGFRTRQGKKLAVKSIAATVYHYGWVRHPAKQLKKVTDFSGLWNGPDSMPSVTEEGTPFDFLKDADSVERFEGTHPAVMQKRIAAKNWEAHFDTRKKRFSFKDRILYKIEKKTGKRLFTHENYTII